MNKNSEPSLQILSEHRNHFPLCFHQGTLYSSSGTSLYKWIDLQKPERVGHLNLPLLARLFAKIRPIGRLLRLGFSHLAIAGSGAQMAIANRKPFFSSGANAPFLLKDTLRDSVRRPMRFGLGTKGKEAFYIAEYFSNPTREEVHLLAAQGNASFQPVFTFPDGKIRHIHLVQHDPYSDHIWIATGDYGPECQIAWLDEGFESLHVIGSGDQSWRATCLLFQEDAVLWGMDSPWEPASIIRWDRRSGEREFLQQTPGPILHGAINENGWATFSTSVEPSFLKEPFSMIWASPNGRHFTQVAAFKKDHWPMHYFQFGLVYFPIGTAPANYIVFSGNAVENYDNTMVIAQLID